MTRRLAAAVAATALLAACAPPGERPGAVPRVSEASLRDKAQEGLALGMRQYQLGDFEDALRNLMAALDHGLLSRSEQSAARKHLAFIHCISGREPECRDEFRKAMEIDPGFGLTPAEAGHPIWGPVYASVRTQLSAAAAAPKAKGPRSVAEQFLDEGMAKYDDGDYAGAADLLQSALRENLAAKADQVKAIKHAAFSLCLLRRFAPCRAAFARAFEIDPDFELSAAEAGHPAWKRTYAGARRRALAPKKGAAGDAAGKK
jgi:tetratricopeptide (TPR) repeat protein